MRLFAYVAEDEDDIELSIMLDGDMQSCDIIDDMPLELLIIDELEIIELSIDELGGQAIDELDIIELSIMLLDDDVPAAKPGTTWAATPPVAKTRASTASCFFTWSSSWLYIAQPRLRTQRSARREI